MSIIPNNSYLSASSNKHVYRQLYKWNQVYKSNEVLNISVLLWPDSRQHPFMVVPNKFSVLWSTRSRDSRSHLNSIEFADEFKWIHWWILMNLLMNSNQFVDEFIEEFKWTHWWICWWILVNSLRNPSEFIEET